MKAIGWAVLAVVLVSVSAALAQSKEGDMVVNVPFPFSVANQHMQPGRYIVAPAMDGILRISDAHNSSGGIHVPVHNVEGKGKGGARVIFHCYGDFCFMTEVWTGASRIGRQFYESKAEKEIISQRPNGTQPNEVAVLQPAR